MSPSSAPFDYVQLYQIAQAFFPGVMNAQSCTVTPTDFHKNAPPGGYSNREKVTWIAIRAFVEKDCSPIPDQPMTFVTPPSILSLIPIVTQYLSKLRGGGNNFDRLIRRIKSNQVLRQGIRMALESAIASEWVPPEVKI
jgi:hypothetical protein